jgi:hypothetical protein
MFTDISSTLSGHKSIYILAHNAGRFDMKVILNPLLALKDQMPSNVMSVISDPNGDIYQLEFETINTTFFIRDSFKLIPASVANISKMFLQNEYKLDVVHTILNEYLRSDSADLTQ